MRKNTRRGSTVRNAPTSSRGLLMTITGHAHAEATLELTCIQGQCVHVSKRCRRHAERLRGSSLRECKRTYRANEGALHCTQSAASHDAHVTPVRMRSARDDFGRAALRQHNAVLDPAVLAERFELRSHLLRLQERARPKESVFLIGMHQHQCILLAQEIRTSPRESRERLGTIIYSEEYSPPWRVRCLAPRLGSHFRKRARDPNSNKSTRTLASGTVQITPSLDTDVAVLRATAVGAVPPVRVRPQNMRPISRKIAASVGPRGQCRRSQPSTGCLDHCRLEARPLLAEATVVATVL